ncbi:SDR family oxidoreductase [Chitinimonas koreensis]|uniref:SDR family oxidoreductase n=1 Tax=Chitinimonas koreensis TaxID=356302 RepID=UPI00041F7A59|nr:SDR family oxidoreductase [Chitinimonas koreensis]QNM96439.1 SDR family oxidoreductase [Chitinimonas koreensis]
MHILLTGASGLIGRALLERLLADGHAVTALCRRPPAEAHPRLRWQAADLATLTTPADWLPLLAGVEAVVNCVGILREQDGQTFEALHERAPAALFAACTEAGVGRAIQLSALGAAPAAATAYWRSKAAGDAALMAQPLDWAVVQPSLVYADAGPSSTLFRRLAAMPVLAVPADAGAVQPIHLDDLVELLLRLLTATAAGRRVIEAVGPRALAWADYLQALRRGMGLAQAPVLRLPAGTVALAGRVLAHWPASLVGPDSLAMLRAGSRADPAVARERVGRPLRDPADFTRPALRGEALLALWLPLARLALAFVWLFTAWVSWAQRDEGLRLLAAAGLPEAWRMPALLAGIALDTLLGALTLLRPTRRLWQVQIALVLAYSIFIALRLPQWWLHPFGPLSKNLPILAWLGLLAAATPRPHR